MEKAFASTLPALIPTRRASARTALVGLQEPIRAVLSECFRQFGIEAVTVSLNPAERIAKEKFEACVLCLTDDAAPVMEAARHSRSNSRCVIYGVGGDAQQAMRYSKFGINAMFHEPLERPAALKLVRATRLLVQHEFRRYVRIPVMTEVSIVGDGRRVAASSIEISSGGMSLRTHEEFSVGVNVDLSFALTALPRVTLRGSVSWCKPKAIGVRFDATDDRRLKLRNWIASCIEH